MQFLRPTSSPAKTALIYITVGTLMIVWTAVYYIYRLNNPEENSNHFYWIGGFFATGLVLVIIGLATGQIGRAARPAEAAPPGVITPQMAANPAPQNAQAPNNPTATNPNPANQPAPMAVVPPVGAPVAGQQMGAANTTTVGS